VTLKKGADPGLSITLAPTDYLKFTPISPYFAVSVLIHDKGKAVKSGDSNSNVFAFSLAASFQLQPPRLAVLPKKDGAKPQDYVAMATALADQSVAERINVWKQFDPAVTSSPLTGSPVFSKPFTAVASFVNTIGIKLTKCSVSVRIPTTPDAKTAVVPDIAKDGVWTMELPGMDADPKSPKGYAQFVSVDLTCAEMGQTRGQFIFHTAQGDAFISEQDDHTQKDYETDSDDDADGKDDPAPVKTKQF